MIHSNDYELDRIEPTRRSKGGGISGGSGCWAVGYRGSGVVMGGMGRRVGPCSGGPPPGTDDLLCTLREYKLKVDQVV